MLCLDSNIHRNKTRGHSSLRPEQVAVCSQGAESERRTPHTCTDWSLCQELGPETCSCAFQAEPSLTCQLLQTQGKTQGTYARHKGFLNQYKSASPAHAIMPCSQHTHEGWQKGRYLGTVKSKIKGCVPLLFLPSRVCIHPPQIHHGGFAMWDKTEHIRNRNLHTTPSFWAYNTSCSKSKQEIKQKNKRLKNDERPVPFSISLKPWARPLLGKIRKAKITICSA